MVVWPVSVPQIHLRRLHSLVLDLKSESPFSTLIEALSLPVLEELRLTLKGRAVTWSATGFQSLAHRSNYFPHLRTFYLENSSLMPVSYSIPPQGNAFTHAD
ncbi:hypothetical protein M378DRAFT_168711 [Amanita muscaria Koide BX008]|uniref:Uncharacterized protein n=1 Tax=Amanita muscaria (strain Koide BX008) TaxID=946122 RepID=A0A0C2WEZ0_AMAMK|nr:hypothetical protein M378DRAFT_168711 [Amanita muscaria Koide BX008]